MTKKFTARADLCPLAIINLFTELMLLITDVRRGPIVCALLINLIIEVGYTI